ncbi:MAG: nitrate reductase molybdenum cofactor assembly chaperone [Hyphomicrobium sp.]|nr:nitrate reductase molybdenum cofactor assembly chaperone [Hyphomicrobium sp.]MBN9276245.1 nitrate reductase molybdenum cofactor assembly chaperone [Hyphomicrobium sp.]OJU26538.1 MAG: nitrate reductase molybdenum cofactor assembly chaperone [Alphaproteobacteria bacterium 64-6]
MKTLKVLSALLSYPSDELIDAAPELKAVLTNEGVLPRRDLAAVLALVDDIAGRDLFDAQERYILLFDRTRSLSLHLFEHVHGESRDRGQAMVDLIKLYEDGGYTPTIGELPDFLPLFLEYAATRTPEEAIELIGQPGHVLAALKERLVKRNSPYAAVFAALVSLSKARLDEAALAALRAEPDPEPDDLEALDAAWEEEEVTFGPGAAKGDCGVDGLAAKLRQARRPAPGLEPAPGAGPRTVITTSPASRG